MKINILYIALSGVLALASCSDFLDTLPDNRTEIDSADKMAKLLVSAYPTTTYIMLTEMSSDNAMDNGISYDLIGQEQEEAYLWKDITIESNDSPKMLWDAHYNAIAAANQVLQKIEEAGNPVHMNAYKERHCCVVPILISFWQIFSVCIIILLPLLRSWVFRML